MTTAKGVVLAAGRQGDRRTAAAKDVARHLQPVANRPILVHAVEGMRNAGIRDVAVVVSPSTEDEISSALAADPVAGVDVRVLVDRDHRGAVSAMRTADDFVADGPFLLQPGDGLLRHDLPGLLGAIDEGPDAIALLGREPDGGSPHGFGPIPGPCPSDGRVPATWSTGAQIYGPEFLDRARPYLDRHAEDPSLHGVLEDLHRDALRIEARVVRWWSRFDGDPRALLDMNRVVLDDLDPGPVLVPDGCDVEGRVLIDPTARVEATAIRGPAVIGPGATVLDAYIGPYTAVGEGALIENAEVEHSVIFAGARVRHIGGRLDRSVIGRGASVVRDFAVPRALRLHIGDGAHVEMP